MRLFLSTILLCAMLAPGIVAQSTAAIGMACADSAGRLSILSAPQLPIIGNPSFSLDVSMGPTNSTAWIYLSTSVATSPLGIGGGCNVYLDLASVNALLLSGISPLGPFSTNFMGAGTLALPLPNSPGLAGTVVVAQAVILDPALSLGFVLSNALQIAIG